MSDADRRKWDARYRQGGAEETGPPSALLEEVLADEDFLATRPSTALDVACGSGRNALYLAGRGFEVDAVDISPEALARGRMAADRLGLTIRWLQRDLDEGLVLPGPYDLIVMTRYLNLALIPTLGRLLNPGGRLVVEVFLDWQGNEPVTGPRNASFRAAPGALARSCRELSVLQLEEGPITGRHGRVEALARIVCTSPAR